MKEKIKDKSGYVLITGILVGFISIFLTWNSLQEPGFYTKSQLSFFILIYTAIAMVPAFIFIILPFTFIYSYSEKLPLYKILSPIVVSLLVTVIKVCLATGTINSQKHFILGFKEVGIPTFITLTSMVLIKIKTERETT